MNPFCCLYLYIDKPTSNPSDACGILNKVTGIFESDDDLRTLLRDCTVNDDCDMITCGSVGSDKEIDMKIMDCSNPPWIMVNIKENGVVVDNMNFTNGLTPYTQNDVTFIVFLWYDEDSITVRVCIIKRKLFVTFAGFPTVGQEIWDSLHPSP